MTEAKNRATPAVPASAANDDAALDAREAEGRIGRAVAFGLPVVTLTTTVVIGLVASVPSALLVAASGIMLGAIALLWASVRTLSGDAPLPDDLEILAAQGHDVDDLAEQKRRILRALKDLENEKAIGRIDDADYEAMSRRYRDDAKDVMRRMDERVAPAMAEAERMARDYLEKRGTVTPEAAAPQDKQERRACTSCGTPNEIDAAFCKKCGASMMDAKGRDATV
jgi:hypothetical protein